MLNEVCMQRGRKNEEEQKMGHQRNQEKITNT